MPGTQVHPSSSRATPTEDSEPVLELGGRALLGVSFGSSTACLCVVKGDIKGKVELIADDDGQHKIPTVVIAGSPHTEDFTGSYFTQSMVEDAMLVGTQAKVHAGVSAKTFRSTIAHFRDLLGVESWMDDSTPSDSSASSKADLKAKKTQREEHARLAGLVPARIQAHPASRIPCFAIDYPLPVSERTLEKNVETSLTHLHSPHDITRIFFARLRLTAADHAPSLAGLVLAVPTDIAPPTQSALESAVLAAGFPRVRFVKEPVAAALAFHAKKPLESPDAAVLVIDLGSHQLNLTLLAVHDKTYSVVASAEDRNLGGESFDALIANVLKAEFERKTRCEVDNKRAMIKLSTAAELVKRTLSVKDTANCSIESLYDGIDFSTTINRAKFEFACDPLFNRLREFIKSFVAHVSALTVDSASAHSISHPVIDQVLLVGGAIRIPKVVSTIRDIFPVTSRVEIRSDVEPDEAICLGAGIQAALIMDSYDPTSTLVPYDSTHPNPKFTTTPTLQKPLGIQLSNGSVVPLARKGCILPIQRTLTFAPSAPAVFVRLVEAANPVAELALDITEGGEVVEVKVEIDAAAQGWMTVSQKGGNEKKVRI